MPEGNNKIHLPPEIEQLQARILSLEETISSLKAKNAKDPDDDAIRAQLDQAKDENKTLRKELEEMKSRWDGKTDRRKTDRRAGKKPEPPKKEKGGFLDDILP